MKELGLMLILAGGGLILVGLLVLAMSGIPFIGRLPGDIRIEGEQSTFYFPVVSCLVISLLATLLYNALALLLKR